MQARITIAGLLCFSENYRINLLKYLCFLTTAIVYNAENDFRILFLLYNNAIIIYTNVCNVLKLKT